MKLAELEPQFIVIAGRQHHYVDDLAPAMGLTFLCPRSFIANGGIIGAHLILCWFRGRGVPDSESTRWAVTGTSYLDLTMVPSIVCCVDGCGWVGHIASGEAADV